MSAIPSKTPLTQAQTQNILKTLSLLTTDRHKASKLVFYDTKIELESDSSTWRTTHALSSALILNLKYIAGYFPEETASRELNALPELMKRVKEAFVQQSIPLHVSGQWERTELAKGALKGLKALALQYQNNSQKKLLVATAIHIVKEIKNSCSSKNQKLELKEKDEKISNLEGEMKELKRQLAEKNQQIDRLRQVFNSPAGIEKMPATLILERMRALLEILEARDSTQKDIRS